MDHIKLPEKHQELIILRDAVENTNEAFVTIDQDSKVIFFNKAAEQMFGYSRDEVIGKNLSHILGADCRAGHEAAVARYVKTGKGTLVGHETEFLSMRKTGEKFSAAISFSASRQEDRLFFTGIIRDMTEINAMKEELDMRERLASLGQAVAEISHEIKNPLTMIGGFSGQLMRTVTGEKNRQKLEIIAKEVDRLEKLLAGLKDYYTPYDLSMERFDLLELIQEVKTLAGADLSQGVRIDFQAGEDAVEIEADRQKLKQVLLNVVKNGLEALQDEGELDICLDQGKSSVSVSITDKGRGIPKAIMDKIFEPFFTTKSAGSGLGLCVSKRIVEAHAGALSLKSKEGKGTCVTIELSYNCGGN